MMHEGYEDDSTITDAEDLWRRIPQRWIVPDRETGGSRISSAAFDDHPNGSPMSVYLCSVVLAEGRGPNTVLMTDFYLAAITAKTARENGQGIHRAPLPEESSHAEVFGKKTKSIKRKLARAAHWVVPPPE